MDNRRMDDNRLRKFFWGENYCDNFWRACLENLRRSFGIYLFFKIDCAVVVRRMFFQLSDMRAGGMVNGGMVNGEIKLKS